MIGPPGEEGNLLPDEPDGVGHHSVRVVLVLGDVVDEGQDELHPGLNQHHVSCRATQEEANIDTRNISLRRHHFRKSVGSRKTRKPFVIGRSGRKLPG